MPDQGFDLDFDSLHHDAIADSRQPTERAQHQTADRRGVANQTRTDQRFQFIEAWTAGHPEVAKLKARAQRLPNVEWLQAQADMRTIYATTRVLLMPSQCRETWGRVITEAQFRGIPAVTSDLGALPETLGPGGIVVPAQAPAEEWAAAVRNLCTDAALYRKAGA